MDKNSTTEQFVKPKLLHNPFLENLNTMRPPLFSPQGMRLPRQLQPPPMYGPRGTTLPPKYLNTNTKPKEEIPEKDQHFYCQTCDMDFNSYIHFQNHNKQHRKCGIDNCSFTGTENAVSQHILNQHSTGIYDTIKNLNTPEEIAKWREERRKRYPSVRNVELRRKAQEERKNRGERLQKPNNRFASKYDQRQLRKRERDANLQYNKRNTKNRESRKRSYPVADAKPVMPTKCEPKVPAATLISKESEDTNENESYKNLQNFKGTSSMYALEKKSEPESNPLLSMLGMYGSSDEEMSSDNESTPENDNNQISRVDIEVPSYQSYKNRIEDCELSSESAPEEIAIERHADDEFLNKPDVQPQVGVALKTNENVKSQSNQNDQKKMNKSNGSHKENSRQKLEKSKTKSGLNFKKLHRFKQNTMLAKLLETDIRHERNLLLQCVRYVVENNFFSK